MFWSIIILKQFVESCTLPAACRLRKDRITCRLQKLIGREHRFYVNSVAIDWLVLCYSPVFSEQFDLDKVGEKRWAKAFPSGPGRREGEQRRSEAARGHSPACQSEKHENSA